jgi:hypothetical protein
MAPPERRGDYGQRLCAMCANAPWCRACQMSLPLPSLKAEAEAWLRRQLDELGKDGVMAAPTLYLVKPPAARKPEPACDLCAVCGLVDVSLPWECDRCGAPMHGECYWGRVATMDEWRRYVEATQPTADCDDLPCLCPACRRLDELGEKGGA